MDWRTRFGKRDGRADELCVARDFGLQRGHLGCGERPFEAYLDRVTATSRRGPAPPANALRVDDQRVEELRPGLYPIPLPGHPR